MQLQVDCLYCKGVGSDKEGPCTVCGGDGKYGAISLPTGYYFAVDVLDCINFAEYNALGDNNKASIALILSAGHVNMNEGNAAMIKLFMCFPEGTATCTKLLALTGL